MNTMNMYVHVHVYDVHDMKFLRSSGVSALKAGYPICAGAILISTCGNIFMFMNHGHYC